jgi:hypothetical protein
MGTHSKDTTVSLLKLCYVTTVFVLKPPCGGYINETATWMSEGPGQGDGGVVSIFQGLLGFEKDPLLSRSWQPISAPPPSATTKAELRQHRGKSLRGGGQPQLQPARLASGG